MLGSLLKNRYRLEQLLSKGEQGALYLATEEPGGEMLTVKVFPPHVDFHNASGLRYMQLMQKMEGLDHPNLLIPRETGYSDGVCYQVLPYFPGVPLEKALEEAPLSTELLAFLLYQLALGLSALHAKGIHHHNIKPSNILVSRNEDDLDLVLTDPGRQILVGGEFPHGGLAAAHYRAPEEIPWLFQTPDERADIYAVGMIGWSALTGKPAFSGLTPRQILSQHLTETPPPKELEGKIPPRFASILSRCLEQKPWDRYQSALALATDFTQWDEIENAPLRDRENARPRPTGLPPIGREHILETLNATLARASAGRGSMVLLTGEEGMGEGHLTEHLATTVEAAGGLFLTYNIPEGEWCPPLGLALGLIQSLHEKWKYLPTTRRRYLAQKLQTLLGRNISFLEGLHPALSELTEGKDLTPAVMPPDRGRLRTLHIVTLIFAALADSRYPLVLYLEGLENADPDSVSWLSHLLYRIPRQPIMMVARVRTQAIESNSPLQMWLSQSEEHPELRWLELPPLTREQMEVLALHRMGKPPKKGEDQKDGSPAVRLTDWIFQRWGGNPLALELVTGLLSTVLQDESGAQGQQNAPMDSWQTQSKELDRLDAAGSLKNLANAWGEGFEETTRSLLQTAAIVCEPFTFQTLLALAEDVAPESLMDTLEKALDSGVLRAAGDKMEFAHPILRKTFQDALPENRKARLHRLMGTFLESANAGPPLAQSHLTALHFRESGEDDRFVTHALKTANQSRNLQILGGAAWWFTEILPRLGNDAKMPKVLMKLGEAQIALGLPHLALDALAQARSFNLSEGVKADILGLTGRAQAQLGEMETALATVTEALEGLGESMPKSQVGSVLAKLATGASKKYMELRSAAGGPGLPLMDEGERCKARLFEQIALILGYLDPDRAVLADEKLLRLGSGRAPSPETIRALIRLGEAQGDPDAPPFAEAVKILAQEDYPLEAAHLHSAVGRSRANVLDLPRARDALFLAREAYSELGDASGEAEALRWLLETHRLQGRCEPILNHAKDLEALALVTQAEAERDWAKALLAYASALSGRERLGEVTPLLTHLIEKAGGYGLPGAESYFVFLLADLLLGSGNHAEAQHLFETTAWRPVETAGLWDLLAEAASAENHLVQARIKPEEKDWHVHQAKGLVEGLRGLEKAFPRLAAETTLPVVMAALTQGNPRVALELAEAGEALLKPQGALLPLGRCYLRMAEGLEALGDETWRVWAGKALQTLETSKLTLFSDRAKRLLSQTPMAPQGPPEVTLKGGSSTGEMAFLGALLGQVGQLLSSDDPDPTPLRRFLLRSLVEVAEGMHGALFLPSHKSGGGGPPVLAEQTSLGKDTPPVEKDLVDSAWKAGRGRLADKVFSPTDSSLPGHTYSALAILLGNPTQPAGAIYLTRDDSGTPFDEVDLERMEGLGRQAGLVLALGNALERDSSQKALVEEENRYLKHMVDWTAEVAGAEGSEAILTAYLMESGLPYGFTGLAAYWMKGPGKTLVLGSCVMTEGQTPDISAFATLGGETKDSPLFALEAFHGEAPVAIAPGAGGSGPEAGLLKALGARSGYWLPLHSAGKRPGVALLFTRDEKPPEISAGGAELLGPLRLITPALHTAFKLENLTKERDTAEEQNRALRENTQAFRAFVPPHLRNRTTGEGTDTGSEVNAPLLFGQIFDMNRLSRLGTEVALREVRGYFKKIQDGLELHNGILDRVMGHQWIARFDSGAESALWAVETLFGLLSDFQDDRSANGLPVLQTGMGVHLGNVILGSVETTDRSEAVILGEPVLVVERLAEISRNFRAAALVSEEAVQALENPENFDLRSIGSFRLGPGENRVGMYEMFSMRNEEVKGKMKERMREWNAAVRLFQQGRFKEADEGFRSYLDFLPHDRAARHFLKLCRRSKSLGEK